MMSHLYASPSLCLVCACTIVTIASGLQSIWLTCFACSLAHRKEAALAAAHPDKCQILTFVAWELVELLLHKVDRAAT